MWRVQLHLQAFDSKLFLKFVLLNFNPQTCYRLPGRRNQNRRQQQTTEKDKETRASDLQARAAACRQKRERNLQQWGKSWQHPTRRRELGGGGWSEQGEGCVWNDRWGGEQRQQGEQPGQGSGSWKRQGCSSLHSISFSGTSQRQRRGWSQALQTPRHSNLRAQGSAAGAGLSKRWWGRRCRRGSDDRAPKHQRRSQRLAPGAGSTDSEG